MFTEAVDYFESKADRRNEAFCSSKIGQILHAEGKFDEAARWAKRALDAAESAGDDEAVMRALWVLGFEALRLEDFKKAADLLSSSIEIAEEIGSGDIRDNGHSILGPVYIDWGKAAMAAGNMVDATLAYESALSSFRQCGHTAGMAVASERLAQTAINLSGDFPKAIVLAEQARRLSAIAGVRVLEADALTSLAEAEIGHGLYEQAGGHLGEAQVIYREEDNRRGTANCLYASGLLFQSLDLFAAARQYAGLAEAMYRDANDREGLLKARLLVADSFRYAGALGSALRSYADIERVAGETGHHPAIALACTGQGLILAYRGESDAARAKFRSAILHFDAVGNTGGVEFCRTVLREKLD